MAEAVLAHLAVDQRVGEVGQVARTPPRWPAARGWRRRGRRRRRGAAPSSATTRPSRCAACSDAEGAVVVGGAEAAVDLGRREHEAPALAEVDDLVELLGGHRRTRLRGAPGRPRTVPVRDERSTGRRRFQPSSTAAKRAGTLSPQDAGTGSTSVAVRVASTRAEGVTHDSRADRPRRRWRPSCLVAACSSGGSDGRARPVGPPRAPRSMLVPPRPPTGSDDLHRSVRRRRWPPATTAVPTTPRRRPRQHPLQPPPPPAGGDQRHKVPLLG